MNFVSFSILILTGVSAGLLSSLFGLGGGLTIIPALVFCLPVFGFPTKAIMHVAIGTGLSIMLINSLNSVRAHHQKQRLNFSLITTMFPSLLIGCLCGSFITFFASDHALMFGFLVFLGLILVKSSLNFFYSNTVAHVALRPITLLKRSVYAFISGIISACTGGGSSLVMVPVLKHHGITIKEAAGTVNALNVFIAVAASLSYAFLGTQVNYNLPIYTTGFIYWPAFVFIILGSLIGVPLGSFMAHKLPEKFLEKLFFGIIIVIFFLMLVKFINSQA